MFRNGEGYFDPTAGLALSHIEYEERLKKRKAALQRQRAAEAEAAARKKKREEWQRAYRKRRDEALYKRINWVHAWPKEEVTTQNAEGENT